MTKTMNKGDKVVYTYHFQPFDIGWGVGYYLFHLSAEQDPLRHHMVTNLESVVGVAINYEVLIDALKNGSVQHNDVPFVFDYNIRPFSEALSKNTEKKYLFFTSRSEQFAQYYPNVRQYYEKIEKYSISYPCIVVEYYLAKSHYYVSKVVNKLLMPFKILTFEIRSVFTLYTEYVEKDATLKQREKRRNPLTYYSEDEKKKIDAETSELEKSKDKAREVLLNSNRAILGFLLAIVTFFGAQYYFKKTELLLNERITVLQKENQSLKDDLNYSKRQLNEKHNENILQQKKIDEMGKRRCR